LEELFLGSFSFARIRSQDIWLGFEFPKLKKLTLEADSNYNFLENWNQLKAASFPNLKHLSVHVVSVLDEHEEEEYEPIPRKSDAEFHDLPMLKILRYHTY